MCVKSIGAERSVKFLETISFSVKTTTSSAVPFTAHVSEITYPLGGQNLKLAKSKYQHLRDLELADESDGSLPLDIDVLIGTDYYWSFIDGKTIKSREACSNLFKPWPHHQWSEPPFSTLTY